MVYSEVGIADLRTCSFLLQQLCAFDIVGKTVSFEQPASGKKKPGGNPVSVFYFSPQGFTFYAVIIFSASVILCALLRRTPVLLRIAEQ